MASTSTSDDGVQEDYSVQWESIIKFMNDRSKKLFEIWTDIGYSPDEIQLRCKKFKEQIEFVVEDENKLRQRLLKSIDELMKQMTLLCEELDVEKHVVCQRIQEANEGMPLIMVKSEMKRQIVSLTEQKQERLKELNGLLERDRQISQELGTAPNHLDPTKLPTASQLQDLRRHIEYLVEEKAIRKIKLQDGSVIIAQLMHQLELAPKTSFEKCIFTGKLADIPLVSENMHKLRQLQEKLEAKIQENEAMGRELRNKLNRLWLRLKFERQFCDEFMDTNQGSKPSTLKVLKSEVARCEELKIQNIKKFVEQIRMELANLWDQCFYNREQRALFRHFNDENYTEELLEAHEREVDRLREFAMLADLILKKVLSWKELFQKMLEIEKKGYDTNRFANRGGQLLQEEKERKQIMIRLPKMEKELYTAVAEWEQENQCPILVEGKRISDYISDQWAQFNTDKENERQKRQQAKAEQLQQDMHGYSRTTTPAKKRPLGTPGRINNAHKKSRLGEPGSSTLVSPAVHKLSFSRKPPSHRILSNRRPATRYQTQRIMLRERPMANVPSSSAVNNTTVSLAESEFVNALTEQRIVGPLNSTAVNSGNC